MHRTEGHGWKQLGQGSKPSSLSLSQESPLALPDPHVPGSVVTCFSHRVVSVGATSTVSAAVNHAFVFELA